MGYECVHSGMCRRHLPLISQCCDASLFIDGSRLGLHGAACSEDELLLHRRQYFTFVELPVSCSSFEVLVDGIQVHQVTTASQSKSSNVWI
jgi:hypothetical protein